MEEGSTALILDVELWELVWLNIPSIVDLCLCGMVCKEWNSRLDPLAFPSLWTRFFPQPAQQDTWVPDSTPLPSSCVPSFEVVLQGYVPRTEDRSSPSKRRKRGFLEVGKLIRRDQERDLFPIVHAIPLLLYQCSPPPLNKETKSGITGITNQRMEDSWEGIWDALFLRPGMKAVAF